jgi:hypothetical protein
MVAASAAASSVRRICGPRCTGTKRALRIAADSLSVKPRSGPHDSSSPPPSSSSGTLGSLTPNSEGTCARAPSERVDGAKFVIAREIYYLGQDSHLPGPVVV